MRSPANLTQVSGLMFEVHSSSTENGLQLGLWYSCSGFQYFERLKINPIYLCCIGL